MYFWYLQYCKFKCGLSIYLDFSCLESFQLEMNKAYQLDNHQAGRSLEAQVQWSVDVVNFRINAEVIS